MPRHKKTKPADAPAELPVLTPQEERLVELVIDGVGNSEAYRIAYDANGYNANSLAVRACRKIASPTIQAHLRAIQAVGTAKLTLTREQRIRDRIAFAARAEHAGNFGAANGAHDAVDKMLGHMVERFEDVTQREADPVDTLRAIAQKHPEIAASLAAEKNIAWDKINDRATKH